MEITKFLLFIVGLVVFTTLLGLAISLPVMWLWNACLIPAAPGLQPIGWLQAWGISILCTILFKDLNNNNGG